MTNTNKTAIVTGVTGQDGSILAEQLLNLGYKVYGLVRRSSDSPNLKCAADLEGLPEFEVVEGDITDLSSLVHLCQLVKAHEFYNLAAMSHVGVSFKEPLHTAQVTGLSVLNCLEAIRLSGIHTRFYQASTSELLGDLGDNIGNEKTPMYPRSPYGCAKLFGFWICVNYRESYNLFASNGILFNHESSKRGPNFVTRKITMAVAKIKAGKQKYLYLGNLDAKRDWGYAPDYCEGMISILNHNEPNDFVLASGEAHSVREFCEESFNHAGLGDYQQYVKIDPKFYRPCEIDVLVGDYSKARDTLGWEPKTTFKELVHKMVDYDISLLEK
jgi:GDPmannose 4,6-dehydratase